MDRYNMLFPRSFCPAHAHTLHINLFVSSLLRFLSCSSRHDASSPFFVVVVFLLPGNTLHSDRSIAHSQIFLLIRKQIKLNSYEILMVFFLFSSMSLFHHQLYGISLPFAREPSTPGSLNIFFFSF